MSDLYTPTTEEVRNFYAANEKNPDPEDLAEFDRWLVGEHDRLRASERERVARRIEAEAEAERQRMINDWGVNAYGRRGTVLHEAARIARGEATE